MVAMLVNRSQARIDTPHLSLLMGIGWGLIGGLAATLVMDLILMALLTAAGLPAFTCYSIVGDTFLSLFSLCIPVSSVPLGVAAHYVIGPVLGGIFGAAAAKTSAAAKMKAFRLETRKKAVILAVLYTEILSQPLLAMTPILLKMTASDTLQWYGGSLVMHMIWGCVMGVVASWGLRPSIAANAR